MATWTLQPDAGSTANFTDASRRTIGVEFYCDVDAWVTHVYYKRQGSSGAPSSLGIWRISPQTTVTTQTWTATTAQNAWNAQELTAPVAVLAGVRYRAAILSSTTTMTGLSNYWTSGGGSSGLVSGSLRMPNATNATGNLQGCYNVGGTLTFPNTGATSRANYGVGVTVTDVDPNPPAFTPNAWFHYRGF